MTVFVRSQLIVTCLATAFVMSGANSLIGASVLWGGTIPGGWFVCVFSFLTTMFFIRPAAAKQQELLPQVLLAAACLLVSLILVSRYEHITLFTLFASISLGVLWTCCCYWIYCFLPNAGFLILILINIALPFWRFGVHELWLNRGLIEGSFVLEGYWGIFDILGKLYK